MMFAAKLAREEGLPLTRGRQVKPMGIYGIVTSNRLSTIRPADTGTGLPVSRWTSTHLHPSPSQQEANRPAKFDYNRENCSPQEIEEI